MTYFIASITLSDGSTYGGKASLDDSSPSAFRRAWRMANPPDRDQDVLRDFFKIAQSDFRRAKGKLQKSVLTDGNLCLAIERRGRAK